MVILRSMTEDEGAAYIASSFEGYIPELARAEDATIEATRTAATAQFATFLPEGFRTPNHYFWSVEVDGVSVGSLWVQVRPEERRAFIFDIVIDEAQRGKGYGEATMTALEAELRPMSVTHIGLNVFGFNSVARALYDKVGYQVAATYMLKRIGE